MQTQENKHMATRHETRKTWNDLDSDSENSSDSNSSTSNDSDAECASPVKKRPWLASSHESKPAESDAQSASGSNATSSRAAAGEAWRRAFQESAIDSQLSRAVGFVSGGVPNIDRDTEAYNYKLAPRLPNKQARMAKRKADLAAISAAVAAGAEEYSVEPYQLELEEFGVPNPRALPLTDAQIDLRHQLEAKKRKRNRDKRQARQRKRAESAHSGETPDGDAANAAADGAMEVDKRQRPKQEKRHHNRNGLNPSHPPEKLSRRLAALLQEPKRHLLERVINLLGADKAIELYRRTQDVESAGGLLVANGNRRRSPGGVYLQLLKSDDSVTPEIIRSVFDGESSSSKEKRKRLRANRRRHKPRTAEAADGGGVGHGGTAPMADSEAAELEAKRAELLAQLDALDEAD